MDNDGEYIASCSDDGLVSVNSFFLFFSISPTFLFIYLFAPQIISSFDFYKHSVIGFLLVKEYLVM